MTYVFDPETVGEVVHECLEKHRGAPLAVLFREITSAFARRYPGHVSEDWDWVYTVAGGGNQQIAMLYVSVFEYLLLVSSPISTGGFTGRYFTRIHDFIIWGELLYYDEGQLEPSHFKPGDDMVLEVGQGHCFRVPDQLAMVEYTRGPIPTMFLLPIVNTLFLTLDFRSLWKLTKNATKLMWKSHTRRSA
jgi:C-8 sterol isomerase